MDNFWKSVGYKTKRYEVIIDIHNKILEAIKEIKDERKLLYE